MYKFLYGWMFSILLGKRLEVELLEHVVSLSLTFQGTARLSSKVAAPLPPAVYEGSNFPTSWATFIIVTVCLFDWSQSCGYIIVVWICISLGLLLFLPFSVSSPDS